MKSRMIRWTGLSLALISIAMLADKIWPARLLGQGGVALACCYDPPAAVIVPDPPATPVPDAAGETQIMATADTRDSPSEASEDRKDTPPFNLFDEPVTAARNAIADGEWLRARVIIIDAEDVFGAEPVLVDLRAEIDAFFGLTDMRAPAATSTDFLSPPSQTLSADADPLATMLVDFGAMSSSAVAE